MCAQRLRQQPKEIFVNALATELTKGKGGMSVPNAKQAAQAMWRELDHARMTSGAMGWDDPASRAAGMEPTFSRKKTNFYMSIKRTLGGDMSNLENSQKVRGIVSACAKEIKKRRASEPTKDEMEYLETAGREVVRELGGKASPERARPNILIHQVDFKIRNKTYKIRYTSELGERTARNMRELTEKLRDMSREVVITGADGVIFDSRRRHTFGIVISKSEAGTRRVKGGLPGSREDIVIGGLNGNMLFFSTTTQRGNNIINRLTRDKKDVGEVVNGYDLLQTLLKRANATTYKKSQSHETTRSAIWRSIPLGERVPGRSIAYRPLPSGPEERRRKRRAQEREGAGKRQTRRVAAYEAAQGKGRKPAKQPDTRVARSQRGSHGGVGGAPGRAKKPAKKEKRTARRPLNIPIPPSALRRSAESTAGPAPKVGKPKRKTGPVEPYVGYGAGARRARLNADSKYAVTINATTGPGRRKVDACTFERSLTGRQLARAQRDGYLDPDLLDKYYGNQIVIVGRGDNILRMTYSNFYSNLNKAIERGTGMTILASANVSYVEPSTPRPRRAPSLRGKEPVFVVRVLTNFEGASGGRRGRPFNCKINLTEREYNSVKRRDGSVNFEKMVARFGSRDVAIRGTGRKTLNQYVKIVDVELIARDTKGDGIVATTTTSYTRR